MYEATIKKMYKQIINTLSLLGHYSLKLPATYVFLFMSYFNCN